MAITKSKGTYFTENERVWLESHQLGLAPFTIGQWKGQFKLPEHPSPDDLRPLFAGAPLPRVQHNRVGCYDLTFTASKSVSILLYALTPTSEWKESAQMIAKAATAQIEPLLAKLEVNAGAQGASKLPAQGAAIGYTHFCSNAGKPHAHFHGAAPNLAHTPDGKIGSIANAKVFYDEHGASLAGFHKELDEHFQRNGYQTKRVGKAVEIVGVPAALIAEFSPARAAMDEARQQKGFSGARAADYYARQARRDVPHGPAKSVSEYHLEWSATAKRHGVTRESLRKLEGQPFINDRRVCKYTAFCTARDALKSCTKRYGTFTSAQYRETVYLLGIGRPTTRADLDKEVSRVLSRPKYAGVRRAGPDATDERYTTRSGKKKQAAAQRAYSTDEFDELKAAAGKLTKTVLVKTAAAATKVLRKLNELIDPAPTYFRLDGRDADAFLASHSPTGYL